MKKCVRSICFLAGETRKLLRKPSVQTIATLRQGKALEIEKSEYWAKNDRFVIFDLNLAQLEEKEATVTLTPNGQARFTSPTVKRRIPSRRINLTPLIFALKWQTAFDSKRTPT